MSRRRLHIDIETYSEVDLREVGVYRYAQDATTELNCLCYAVGDGPVKAWLPGEPADFSVPGVEIAFGECPADLKAALDDPAVFIGAHNAQFERVVLNSIGWQYGLPELPLDRMVCTAAKASAMGLPRSLEDAASALGTYPKMAGGRVNMLALSKPRTGRVKRYSKTDFPDKWAELVAYCVDDVRAERDLDEHLPDLPDYEQRVYRLDQVINGRGIRVDNTALADVQFLVNEYRAFLEKLCQEWTGLQPTQTLKLADWIRGPGKYPQLVDMKAPSVEAALKDKMCPPQTKKVLKLRSTHAMKAVAKFDVMERAQCADERLRGMMIYYGAGTGRWSSVLVQLQNLFRPVIGDIPTAIEAFAARDLAWIRDLYEANPMKVFASSVRGMLIAALGHDLLALDYAAIEARILAWLAGQRDVVEVFAGHGKIYEYTAAKIYRKPMEAVTSSERFIGKVAVLALGYQGGQAAFAKMAKNYGVDIPEDLANGIKEDWRRENRKIVQFWYDLENCAKEAVKHPGKAYYVPGKKVGCMVHERWLMLRLPSGRKLAYLDPEFDVANNQVTYMGIDTYSRRWKRVSTYGGRLTENVVQATARDLMVNGILKLESAGYPLVLTVHDEAVMEVPEGFGSVEEAGRLMCQLPAWADGLPVKAEGWRGKRYRK